MALIVMGRNMDASMVLSPSRNGFKNLLGLALLHCQTKFLVFKRSADPNVSLLLSSSPADCPGSLSCFQLYSVKVSPYSCFADYIMFSCRDAHSALSHRMGMLYFTKKKQGDFLFETL